VSALTRRQFIGAAGLAVVANGLTLPARGVTINPRSSWAVDRPPKGPLSPEEVRFLIVHHSASRNGHSGADTPAILRSFYDFHTSPEKGWDDIAYNFLIDADGGIWEGRAGSLAGPVVGDAAGGNQGYTQLVCIIGDYNSAQPTATSLSSLVALLAWLADRYEVSTAPGAQISFTSRGSNLHPAGIEVVTPTITGHRTMSRTSCPGANLDSYVVGGLTADVETARGGAIPSPTPPPSTTATVIPTTTTFLETTTTRLPASASPSTTIPSTTSPAQPGTTLPVAVVETEPARPIAILATVGVLGVSAAALLVWRQRRMSDG
jgi:hypothetical protein